MSSTKRSALTLAVLAVVAAGLDAIAGRALQASPTPSIVLGLGLVAWTTLRLTVLRQPRAAILGGVAAWVIFLATYWLAASSLVGWNGSLPWRPRGEWLLGWTAAAVAVAAVARATMGRSLGRAPANTRSAREISPEGSRQG